LITLVLHQTSSSIRLADGTGRYREYTELDDGYCAILGSPNGANAMRMLLDHKAQLGYRLVDRIVVLSSDHAEDSQRARSFFIVLSEPREKPWWKFPSRIAIPNTVPGVTSLAA
jgi:hypothetical protein